MKQRKIDLVTRKAGVQNGNEGRKMVCRVGQSAAHRRKLELEGLLDLTLVGRWTLRAWAENGGHAHSSALFTYYLQHIVATYPVSPVLARCGSGRGLLA